MNFKIKLVIGFLAIISVMIIYGLFVNEIKKIPLNYEYIAEQEGQDQVLSSLGGNLSEPFGIRETLRENVINVTGDILEINSTILGRDPMTNKIVFDDTHTFFVDRTTEKHQSMNGYFTFPPNVQKIDYDFFHPMIFSETPFVFEKVFTARYEESDFGEQIVEVSIEENGAATITGFPVLGCPA